ncbi:ABC transporter [Clostridiaceae bacterium 35-E11]
MQGMKKAISFIGISRLIMITFLFLLVCLMYGLGLKSNMIITDCFVRVGMNGFFVLAMMISIVCGAGLNFGLPIGIVCGLLGGAITMQMDLKGMPGFLTACALSVLFASIVGYFYGQVLNKVKGSEMMVGNYLGFSIVSLMCIFWMLAPFSNPKIVWPMTGFGIRNTLTLEENYGVVLDNFFAIKLGEDLIFPTGLYIVFLGGCLIMWLFLKTKVGVTLKCAGENPIFAKTIGIDDNRARIIGTVISTVLAAVGINIYSQSFSFYQFYSAPLMMAFPAIAAILIGGATPKKANVFNVILGTVLFQSILTIAMPVANKMVTVGSLSEVTRVIVSNGIILYALTKISKGGGK